MPGHDPKPSGPSAPSPLSPVGIRPNGKDVATWLGLYVGLALLPLVVALLGDPPDARGFWIEFGVALGFVALALLILEFALTARFQRIAAPFGTDTLLHFHRQAGMSAFAFLLGHVLVLMIAHSPFLEFLDPRVLFTRAVALWSVLGALALLLGLALWRKPIGLAYQWWRATHALLAVFVLFVGTVHVIQVSHYGDDVWKKVIWVGMSVVALSFLLHSRLLKPWRMRKKTYRIVDVQPERGESWTLTLEPVGHAGMQFKAGQFAWLAVGPSPFVIDAHPFSFVSSAERPDEIRFTMKELGDWTATVGRIKPGTTAFLNGPYGAFTLAREASGAVFIPGGIGVTPIMSMLRTMRDRGDRRPVTLIYAVKTWEGATFREELSSLEEALTLTTVYVVEKAPEGWQGETGFLTPELLERHLPPDDPLLEYFLCGPGPMMDIVEPFLKKDRRIPTRRLNAERFDIA